MGEGLIRLTPPRATPAGGGMKPVALVSGGSSGIGFAAAAALLKRGYRVVLASRGRERLETAAEALRARFSALAGDSIVIRALDVTDRAACAGAVSDIEREIGPISLLMCSAGIAEPGHFLEQPIETHVAHIETNYLGTIALAHPVARAMAARGRGNIILVGSGAGFVGIYGYGAYGPSKFAVRGLAETLRAELTQHGVIVSLACPPDTDTPQYRGEQATKPAVTKAISASGGLASAEAVAERIIAKALKGRFVITHGWPLFALRWVHSTYGPYFIHVQQRLARRLRR